MVFMDSINIQNSYGSQNLWTQSTLKIRMPGQPEFRTELCENRGGRRLDSPSLMIVPAYGLYGLNQHWKFVRQPEFRSYVKTVVDIPDSPSPHDSPGKPLWSLWTQSILKIHMAARVQELCENRGEHPGLPVPNSPYGFCGLHVPQHGWAWIPRAVLAPSLTHTFYFPGTAPCLFGAARRQFIQQTAAKRRAREEEMNERSKSLRDPDNAAAGQSEARCWRYSLCIPQLASFGAIVVWRVFWWKTAKQSTWRGEWVTGREVCRSVGAGHTLTYLNAGWWRHVVDIFFFFSGLGYGSGRKRSSIIIDHDHEGWVCGGASTAHRFALCL